MFQNTYMAEHMAKERQTELVALARESLGRPARPSRLRPLAVAAALLAAVIGGWLSAIF